jgi:hypothetical protein
LNKICPFENYLFLRFKKSVLKSTLLLLFFISFSVAQAQSAPIDSVELARRTAFQDSIFKGLLKPQPYKTSSKKNKEKDAEIKVQDATLNPVDSILKTQSVTVVNDTLIDSVKTLSNLTAQQEKIKFKKQKKVDTTQYSPKKAAIWGAAFPGLGQVYNKKYWKLPIVYGILGTVMYFVASNGKKLREFNGYIRNEYDSIPNPAPYDQIGLSEIESFRNTYRRNVQIASFGTVFAWGLSIVDAVVDAHLKPFDISDKLTFKIKPTINYSNFTYYTGIGVHLNLK